MRSWALLLVLGIASCAPPADPGAAHDAGVSALEQGNLPRAEQIASEFEARIETPRESSDWLLRLLRAETLIAKGNASDAVALVASPIEIPGDTRALEARRLKVRAHAALNLGDHEQASQLLAAAGELARATVNARLGLEVDVLRGLLLIRLNRQSEGESVTRAALSRAVASGDSYWQAAAANNLGLQMIRAFRYDQAIPFLQQALEAARGVQAQRFMAASLANLGLCYFRIGDFGKALSLLEEAGATQERIGALTGLQSSLGEIGNTHFMLGDTGEAIAYYQRALTIARSSAPWDAAKWAGNLATAHAELKQWNEAEHFSREALKLEGVEDPQRVAYSKLESAAIAAGRGQHPDAIHLYEETIRVAGDNADLIWEANAGLGATYAALGSPDKARLYFERCLETIDGARRRLAESEYRLTFLARLIGFYQLYVDLLVTQGDIVKALQVADSSRAVLLSEHLHLDGGWRTAVATNSLQRAARTGNVTFLSYWLAPERSFLWVVGRQTLKLIELPPRGQISSLVDAYRTFIETGLRDPIGADFTPARELYEMLLAPARALIPPGSNVVVVPDGPLHSLNLETLPVFDDAPHYFIEDVTVSVAPSLALAIASELPRVRRDAPLLVVGDPEPAGRDFPRLADAAREVQSIRERFGEARTTLLTGVNATPAAYEGSRPERFSVIHFAAHATANRASPLDSAVVLSPHENGYMLTARDVLEHRLDAELVTLSACRSAGARIYGGEGIVGFVWAFLQAGARNVVAGLWDVSDRSTSLMMDTLYERLHAGEPPASALRRAKLTLIKGGGTFAHPYYWGPFQLYIGGRGLTSPPPHRT